MPYAVPRYTVFCTYSRTMIQLFSVRWVSAFVYRTNVDMYPKSIDVTPIHVLCCSVYRHFTMIWLWNSTLWTFKCFMFINCFLFILLSQYDNSVTLIVLWVHSSIIVTHLVWPHQPENPPGRPRARRISPWRSPSLFPLSYSNIL